MVSEPNSSGVFPDRSILLADLIKIFTFSGHSVVFMQHCIEFASKQRNVSKAESLLIVIRI